MVVDEAFRHSRMSLGRKSVTLRPSTRMLYFTASRAGFRMSAAMTLDGQVGKLIGAIATNSRWSLW
jgi:hypothetical protein